MTTATNQNRSNLINRILNERDETIPSSWTKSTWGKSTKPDHVSPNFFKPLTDDVQIMNKQQSEALSEKSLIPTLGA